MSSKEPTSEEMRSWLAPKMPDLKLCQHVPSIVVSRLAMASEEGKVRIFTELVSNLAMDFVWEELVKQKVVRELPDKRFLDWRYLDFADSVHSALTPDAWEELPPKERDRELEKLTRELKSVARRLTKFGVTGEVYELFNDLEFPDIDFGSNAVLQKEDGTVESIDATKFEVSKGNPWPFELGSPDLPTLLFRCADKLTGGQPQLDAVLKKPGRGDAMFKFFCLKLSANNREWYGEPLVEVVSATASIFFTDKSIDVSPDKVRLALIPS